ncbi:MAG: hypothetical protein HQ502_19790 [Alphaproteobacteria bacterium]|nr:hypothetical protein [Alphaproteobacteria bacterium]
MKLLHLPNEPGGFIQSGPRMAFKKLLANGVIGDYLAYSFEKRNEELANHQAALEELRQTVQKFQPDVIFIQHMNKSYSIDRKYVQDLKSIASKPKIVIQEADAYGRNIKRIDSTQRALFKESDMVFLVGLGYLAEEVRKSGAQRVRYIQHAYDDEKFGTSWRQTTYRKYDAIMTGNLHNIKRLPSIYMPGGKKRKETAGLLEAMLRERFAIFGGGKGWKNLKSHKGPIPFYDQEKYIRSAWVTVGWDHFNDLPMYSSDRVPISIACGVPHVTNHQPGFEHLYYSKTPGLYAVKSPQDVVDVTINILSLTVEERINLGESAAKFARENLTYSIIFARAMDIIIEQLFGDNPSTA